MKTYSFRKSLHFAVSGVNETWKSEKNFRIQIILGIGGFVLFAFMGANPIWWALFSLSSGAVLTAELINTSIEKLSDFMKPGIHPAIKLVKDASAGAVLISSLTSIVVLISFLVEKLGK